MYCDNCDLSVETEQFRTTDADEARTCADYDVEVSGDYDLDEVGDVAERGGESHWQIRAKVYLCANCGVPLRVRTYLHRTVQT